MALHTEKRLLWKRNKSNIHAEVVYILMLVVIAPEQSIATEEKPNQRKSVKNGKKVDYMRLHLFWIDSKWKKKGCADNYNLIVDMEKKVYKVYVNPFLAYHRPEDIEVKRKSDIVDYVEYLKQNGFMEVETI